MTVHLLTPEYPPMHGGVADYTRNLAAAVAHAGAEVHVWCPPAGARDPSDRVVVHEACGTFEARDLERVGSLLDTFDQPRRLIVQWVPHGYGRRAMNVGFCSWLWKRARGGDCVELMVHEPYLAFSEGSWRQNAAAVVQRAMVMLLLRAAQRVWVSIPAWTTAMRPYALGRRVPFAWLPIPSNLAEPDTTEVAALRRRLGAAPLAGHLGTYGRLVTDLLGDIIEGVLTAAPQTRILLIGAGSDRYAREFSRQCPALAERVLATGTLTSDDLARHVAACDVLLQPFPDGVSSRRTSVMAGMKLNVPVVTTNGRLSESLWVTTGAVRLAPVGDSREFVAHAVALIDAPDDRARLADTARRVYDEHFAIGRTLRALEIA
jgi:glycosyltransferase involved in cell wall biosynthesis